MPQVLLLLVAALALLPAVLLLSGAWLRYHLSWPLIRPLISPASPSFTPLPPLPQVCAYHRYTGSWLTWESDHDFLAAGGLDGRLLGTSEVQDAIVATIDER